MIDPLLLAWVFAQAASQAMPPLMIVSNVITAVLTAPASIGLLKLIESRQRQRAANERAAIDADKTLKLADIEARRAHEEEVTGRHEIDAPIAERFAIAEREERQRYQALVRELDTKLAASNEQVVALRAEVARLMETVRVQAEALVKAHLDNERTLDWIESKLGEKPPRPEALPDGIEVIRAVRVDPRREP